MPRGLMDDLEGEVADEKFHECALGNDILSADLDCEDALLLNIRQHRVFSVTHNVGRLVCGELVGKVPNPLLNMVSECVLTLISYIDISMSFNGADLARNDAVLQHPRRFPFADMKHLVKLLQGYFTLVRHHINSPRGLTQTMSAYFLL